LQRREPLLQLLVAQRLRLRFLRIDGGHQRLEFLDVAFVLRADKSRDKVVDKLGYIHERLFVSWHCRTAPSRCYADDYCAEKLFFFRRPGLQPRRKASKTNGL